jgi:hypothetical protein
MFYELPQVCQDQLAQFHHFLTTQADKIIKVASDSESTIGARLRVMKVESTNLTVVSFDHVERGKYIDKLLVGGRHFDETTGYFE